MTPEQEIRLLDMLGGLTLSFGRIANALEGINETAVKAGARFWPEHREPREPVITRPQTEEDKLREAHGQDGKSFEQWLEIPEDEREFIGSFEREFLARQVAERNAGAEADSGDGSEGGRPTEAESQAGNPGDDSADHSDVEERGGGIGNGPLSDEIVRAGRSHRGIPTEI